MSNTSGLNFAPYYDDFDAAKKYYRVVFKAGRAVQARELTTLQTTLQNQITQFGDNIFKSGSIVKGCSFTELRDLSYVKVVDGITPSLYVDRIETPSGGTAIEYYYEISSSTGLKAYIVGASNGFLTRSPDTNTFFVNYLNTVASTQQKAFVPGEVLSVKEYRIIKSVIIDPLTHEENINEVLEGGDVVATTSVATFSDPIGKSVGLSVAEGVIFQKGYFLYTEPQTIILTKYVPTVYGPGERVQPHGISIGFRIDQDIITSQQDSSLLDNSNGSENENAPGADRLRMSPILVAVDSASVVSDSSFFSLRKYTNGVANQIRDVSQYNVIGEEMARRTFEESGDYIQKRFTFDSIRDVNDDVNIRVSPGVVYAKGYRVENNNDIFLPVDPITTTGIINDQPISANYGGYVRVVSSSTAAGVIDINTMQTCNLLAADGTTVLGTAIVKNYTADISSINSAPLNTSTAGRLYLFAIRMKDTATEFASVKYVKQGAGKLEIVPSINQPNSSTMIFDVGQDYIKNISNLKFFARKSATVTIAGGSSVISIAPGVGESFNNECQEYITVIGNGNTRLYVTSPSISGGNLTFTVNQVGGTATVYYSVTTTPGLPKVKQSLDVYVKTTFLSAGINAKTRYTLGLPDVYQLISVTSATTDFSGSFRLNTNQKDNFYDHSYIELIAGKPVPPDNTLLTVKVRVLKPDSGGTYNVFTVNSYASIEGAYIPVFSGKSGTYNLRDCIDLRPYRTVLSGVTYATTEGAASTIGAAEFVGLPVYTDQLFSAAEPYLQPALALSNSTTVEFYNNRTDSIVVDSYGTFTIVKGNEAAKSRPIQPYDKTVIANVYVPGFPLYTYNEATSTGRPEYGLSISAIGASGYTMQDIQHIDEQVERLTYYVSLSSLENETKNMLIRDSAGNDRFKNGFLVDPFNDLSIADISDPSFNASIDLTEKSLAPAVKTFPVNMKVAATSGTDISRNAVAAISSVSDDTVVISQPYATNYRSATSNFYKFAGDGFLSPDYDNGYDVVTNPKTVSLDFTGAFSSLVDTIQEFVPLTTSSSSTSTTSTTTNKIKTTTSTLQTTVSSIQQNNTTTLTDMGDYVTDIRFNPYMRTREIKISLFGLRPNTRHYFFFGRDDVNAYVAPAILKPGASASSNLADNIGRSDVYGAAVYANGAGELYAVFNLPASTYYVGEQILDVADVNTYADIEVSALSSCKLVYRAYSFTIDKTGLTLSTKMPEFSVGTATTTTTRTVATRRVVSQQDMTSNANRSVPRTDPLAQTFFIKSGMSDASCIYISKMDLFFKRKSPTNGVSVMIREVVNGYPSSETLPYSKVHLTTSEVNVSEKASVATTVIFDAPVRLDTEKEYAFVIMPDAADPDYLVFTSKVGGLDLQTNIAVTQDAFDGVLFTSTNDRSWTSYQDEDVKFTLYRHSFNVGTSTVTLETDSPEFFTFSDWTGKMQSGELVYTVQPTSITAVFTKGSDVIPATNIGSSFNVGDWIYVVSGGVKDLLRVTSVAGDNNSVVVHDSAKFSGSLTASLAVVAKICHYNQTTPNTAYAEASSARAGNIFEVGDTITGILSGATAVIGSINNIELSYVQPMLNRVTDESTDIQISIEAVDPANPSDTPYTMAASFGDKTSFNQIGGVIYSKSNDVISAKNLKIILTLTTRQETDTPCVDVESALALINIYNVTSSTYLSRVVNLADGFDAEDFKLYITGYRPVETDIIPYIRLQNTSDPLQMSDNPWIPLQMEDGVGVFSSTSNINDFKEFVYTITNVAGSNYGMQGGIVYYTNAAGKFIGYKNFQLKIVLSATSVGSVPRMLDYRGIAIE